jgi:hypothetical protein
MYLARVVLDNSSGSIKIFVKYLVSLNLYPYFLFRVLNIVFIFFINGDGESALNSTHQI